MGDIVRGVDEPDMGERLRKIADEALSFGVVFLGEQAHVVAQSDQFREQALRVGEAPKQDIGIGQPEAAGKEGAFAGWQAVFARRGVVAEYKPVAQKLSLDGLDGSPDTRVLGWQKADLRDQQRARIQQVAVVRLGERAQARVE